MTNRINQLFEQKRQEILSVFFTAGHPKLEDTVLIINELQSNGVSLIEIGIPFSDPMADGKVIQESSAVALKNGMSLRKLLSQLRNVRNDVHIPLIMMGYLNPIMQFGFENFCRECSSVGIDGMIIPDLPFHDYMESYREISERYGLHIIMLITPETSEERIRLIDEHTSGFIYLVSSAATTGTQLGFGEDALQYFRRIKAMNLRNPLMVGFGISNREMVQSVCEHAAGAIVGSKFIKLLDSEGSVHDAVKALVSDLR
ncbi:MAG: tryptophan synthase subunit alpha [Bacteroidales bacterium]|jgi:tryptophan synthase alpha chain|nr:tryptophan synthase subunit alpha [Bacteroidales bacterium]